MVARAFDFPGSAPLGRPVERMEEMGELEMMSCPILNDLQSAHTDLRRTFRRIRRDLQHCKTCSAAGHCTASSIFVELIRQAISETLVELQVVPLPPGRGTDPEIGRQESRADGAAPPRADGAAGERDRTIPRRREQDDAKPD